MAAGAAPLVFSNGTARGDELTRAVTRGALVRLARGIYTADTRTPPATVVRRHIWPILAHETPGAVISDLSVEDGGIGSRGVVYRLRPRLSHSSGRPIIWSDRRSSPQLPSCRTALGVGSSQLEGDLKKIAL